MFVQHLAVALPLLAGVASAQCYKGVNIFQARGTGEPPQGSLSDIPAKAAVQAIPDSHLTKVLYSANATFGPSIINGTVLMSNMVNDYHKQCPDSKIVLEGYSQGAIVVGNVLTGAIPAVPALSDDVGRQIVAIIQYGDPQYQAGQSYDRADCTKDGGGVRSGSQRATYNSYSSKIASFCKAKDPVCCTGGNDVIAHASYFTNENAQEVADFVKQQYDGSGSTGGSSSSAVLPSGISSGNAVPSTAGGAGGAGGAATSSPTGSAGITGPSTGGSGATPTGTSGGNGANPSQTTGSGAAGAGSPSASSPASSSTGAASHMALNNAGSGLVGVLLAAFML